MRDKLLLILFFLSCSFRLGANDINGMKFDKLSVSDGLSHNWVRCIYKDHKGFLWIGTWNGLNRYNGKAFTVYKNKFGDSTSLRTNKINFISQLSNGELWVGCVGGYISIYNREQDKFDWLIPPTDKKGRTNINAVTICENNKNQVFIGTKGRGLDIYNLYTKKFQRFVHKPKDKYSISSNTVNDIVKDERGRIWIATDNGLNLFKNGSFITFYLDSLKKNNKINVLFIDYRNRMWIGSDTGVKIIDLNKNPLKAQQTLSAKNLNFIDFHSVRHIIGNKKGIIYIGTDNGLIVYDLETNQYARYKPEIGNNRSLTSESLYSILLDDNETLWLGTYNAGVNFYSPYSHQFEHITSSVGALNNPHVNNISAGYEQDIWINTDGGGVNVYDTQTGTFQYFLHDPQNPNSISNNKAIALYKDTQQNIWIGTYNGGLNRYNPRDKSFQRFVYQPDNPFSISGNTIFDITGDINGDLIILTNKSIQKYNPKNQHFIQICTASDIPYNYQFHTLQIDSSGAIWLGGYMGIFYIDRKKGKKANFYHNINGPIRQNFNVLVFFQDNQGRMWAGLDEGGLKCFFDEKLNFKQYTTSNGLPHNTISNVFQDNLNNIWVTSNVGISKLKGCIYLKDTITHKTYKTNNNNAGYDFKKGCLFKHHNSGLVYIGSNSGISVFNPDNIRDNPYRPPIVITGLKIFNKPVFPSDTDSPLEKVIEETKKLVLTASQNVFTLEFVALNYIFPEKNQFAYRLDGFDPKGNHWNYVGTKNEITYTNLNPGEYVLHIIGANNDGVWNTDGVSLKIKILPPFWKTWLFRILMLILTTAIVLFWIYLRTNNLNRKKKELETMVTQRTRQINRQNEILEQQAENLKKSNEMLKQQQLEIIEQKNNIEYMAKQVEEATTRKLRFFTNISHEFRTPLTLILGPLEQLLNKEDNGEKKRYLTIIQRNAQRLYNLINQLIDIRKSEQNKLQLTLSKSNIVKHCKGIVSLFTNLAKENSIELKFDAEPEKITIWFDNDKIEKIMYNLISNAFKFTETNGKIHILIKKTFEKSFSNDEQIRFIQISVSDTGIGIPPEEINKLFDRFYHIETYKKSRYSGTGIGLAYAKELIDLHKGKITVNSVVNKGTEFTVLIPEDEKVYSKECFQPQPTPTDFNYSMNALTSEYISQNNTEEEDNDDNMNTDSERNVILIIDDNKDLREFLRKELINQYEILEAANGKTGINKTKKYLPDLVLCDVMMPKMNGFEYVKQIKTNMLTSHIPVILLTAKSDDVNRIFGFDTGADDYITKPFSIDILISRIKNLIEQRNKLRENFGKSSDSELLTNEFNGNALDKKFIDKAIQVIEQNLSKSDFDHKKFANEMFMGKSQLYSKLKALTNQTAHEFIKTVRLKKAAKFLENQKYHIAEVAYLTGFNSPVYFSKCFKEEYGMSPSDFQKQTKQKS